MTNDFRGLVPRVDHPCIAGISERDAYSHAAHALATRERIQGIPAQRRQQLAEPFKGITTNGAVLAYRCALADGGAPTQAMFRSARQVMGPATADQHMRLCHPIDAPQWRMRSNPELYFDRFGLHLDEIGGALRDAILGVLEASLSRTGYAKARGTVVSQLSPCTQLRRDPLRHSVRSCMAGNGLAVILELAGYEFD